MLSIAYGPQFVSVVVDMVHLINFHGEKMATRAGIWSKNQGVPLLFNLPRWPGRVVDGQTAQGNAEARTGCLGSVACQGPARCANSRLEQIGS